MKYYYSMFQLESGQYALVRVANNRLEALYERKRGKIALARWDNWVPQDHELATFSYHDASEYTAAENEEVRNAA